MALKLCAIFGGAPAGPLWGWLGLKDMISSCATRCTRAAQRLLADSGGEGRYYQHGEPSTRMTRYGKVIGGTPLRQSSTSAKCLGHRATNALPLPTLLGTLLGTILLSYSPTLSLSHHALTETCTLVGGLVTLTVIFNNAQVEQLEYLNVAPWNCYMVMCLDLECLYQGVQSVRCVCG